MHVSRPSWNTRSSRARIAFAFGASMMMACSFEKDSDAARPLNAAVSERVTLTRLGDTPLGDSAMIVALAPEPDGEAIAAIVRDPSAGVSAALALADSRRDGVFLLWPDSVAAVWWLGDGHDLGFTTATGRGSRVVVDVHAAMLEAIERDVPRSGGRSGGAAPGAGARVLVDSLYNLRLAPGSDALRFQAIAAVPSPDAALQALYVAARDSAGTLWNPRWMIADSSMRAVTLVDSITGPAIAMPRGAAGWTRDGRFFYARGLAIVEAAVRGGRGPAAR